MKKAKQPKPQPTAEQIYKRNRKKAKRLKRSAPIVWIMLLSLTLLMSILAFKHSVGNVLEIMTLLDGDRYNKTEIAENYKMLVERWGEWKVIGGESGGVGFTFIDIKHAMFSGLAITYMTLAVVSFALAVIIGKILLPKLAKYYEESNDSMVDIATLRTNEILTEKKKNKKEWF